VFQQLFSYAFRPFFLLGSLFAIVIVGLWTSVLHAPMGVPAEMLYWHGHEMLVGFAMAAVAGFLLTAVANWTGRQPLSGAPLVWLALSWLAGRLAMGFAFAYPAWVAAAIDMLFPLSLAFFAGREIILAGDRRNLVVVLIVSLLAVFNLFYHLGRAGVLPGDDRIAIYLMLHFVLFLTAVIAGRIVPNFTANWLRQQGVEKLPATYGWLDALCLLLTAATGIAIAYLQFGPIPGSLALAAALAHACRLFLWRGLATISNPLLFVLHVAYVWFPVGYLATAAAAFGYGLPASVALHALSMGVIGTMILAVSSRVALGHTGRPLLAARAVVVAYWCLTIGVVLRLSGAFAANYLLWVDMSALAWMLAFGIFFKVYWPVLTGPRADE